ncbi:YncE family protein [Streptomyces sp. TP-A0356]|uniref:YncE family protein n=1 Tax=Streptomyces sp. TP-A0356 TaxID=1359208 RepID=UPI0006E25934|nr:hypothetical protein [Streptomyces sp. TP-A0356]
MRIRTSSHRLRPSRPAAAGAALAVLLGAATAVGTDNAQAAHAAATDSRADLPISPDWPQGEMAVDGVHQHVFISDPKTNTVVVTDYAGKVVGRITGEAGANGMAVSRDSATLYVALTDADAIAAVDTATLKETARFATGANSGPLDLAFAGGKLWFSYGKYAQGGGNLGSLDFAAAKPAVALNQSGGVSWEAAPQLSSAPSGDQGVLVAGNQDRSPEELTVYDVSSGTAQLRAHRKEIMPGAQQEDIALSPDGKDVMTADRTDNVLLSLDSSDLGYHSRSSREFQVQGQPNAVEYAANGDLAVGMRYSKGVDVYVFRPGEDNIPVRAFTIGDYNLVEPRGVAWAPDGSKLFVLTEEGLSPGHLTLRVFDDPTKAATGLKVTAPVKSALGEKLTLHGTFAYSVLPLPGSVTVQVTRTDLASPKGVSLGSRTVWLSAQREFDIDDVPAAGGKVTYTLRYPGDATHAASTASVTVDVPRNKTTLTLDGDGRTVTRGTNTTLRAKLGRTWRDRTVSVYAQPAGGTRTLVRAGTVDRDGNLVITYKVTRNTTFTAVFPGDPRTEPAQDTSLIKVSAR